MVFPTGLPITVSPLERWQQLAFVLRQLWPDLRFETDWRIVELDFGAREGRAWSAIEQGEFDPWFYGASEPSRN